jgi:hypothetical protein
MANKNDDFSAATLSYQNKCLELVNISEKVRYVGIINRYGRTVAGKLRKNITPLLSPEQARDEHFVEAIRQQLRNSFDKSIGKTDYSITKNDLVTLVLVPSTKDNVLIYITLDKDVPLQDVSDVITKIKEIDSK